MGSVFGFDTEKVWEYENGFYLLSEIRRTGKFLTHYELYKQIIDLPGEVVELGVYKGVSFMRFAAFRELLEQQYSRKLIGFDAFGIFPVHDEGADREFIKRFENEGGNGIPQEELEKALTLKKVENFELVKGDIMQTLPAYVEAHPELRISLLHVDVDVYSPSKLILELLYDRLVPGGILMLDDYGMIHGETVAVDEFFAGKDIVIEKSPLSNRPSFIVKPPL